MKRKSIVLLGTLALMAVANSGLAQSFLTNGLVAYYPFDGNANDASGNGKNGVASGVTQTTNRFGATGSAYQFDGVNAVVTVAPLASINMSAMTLSAWIKPTAAPSQEGCVISKWAAFSSPLADYMLSLRSNMRITLGNADHTSNGGKNVYSTNAFALGQWAHVVATVDSTGSATIWINGAVSGKGTIYAPVPPAAVPVRIGQLVTESGSIIETFNGSIDDVRIYDRALPAAEVQELYAYESQPSLTAGLVAYYPFDGNANDASGNTNNGVVANVTMGTDRFGTAGSACQFNGSSSSVTVPSLASTNLSAMTLSAWVKPMSVPSVQASIINKWATYTGSLGDYALLLLGDLRAHFGNGRQSSSLVITSTNALSAGQWYHVVVTLDAAGTATMLVNGVLQAKGYVSPLLPPATEPVRIGYMVTASGARVDTFDGSIDDVRIYNRALSDLEVQALYAQESQPACIPHAATAVAQVVNGFVVGATITDPGCGYTEAPMIKIIGSGTGATATATLSNGSVTEIKITSTGSGYSTNTTFRIASPPSVPWLQIGVSKVNLTMHVTMGKNYIVEASTDMVTWTQVGSQFTAEDEVVVQEFAVDQVGRYFRVTQVP